MTDKLHTVSSYVHNIEKFVYSQFSCLLPTFLPAKPSRHTKNVYQKTVLRQLICMQKVEKIRSGNFLTCDNILIIFVKLERIIICGDMNMAFGMHPLYAIPVSFKSGQQLKSLAPDGQV